MKHKKLYFSFILLELVFLVVVMIILFVNRNSFQTRILGNWVSSGGTIYTFQSDNTGSMIVPLSEYSFTYVIEKRQLSIDYSDKKVLDVVYDMEFKNDQLILKGEKGTFIFKRK